MFVQPLVRANQRNTKLPATESQYEISDSGYGKDAVKILHIRRQGAIHSIKEYEVGSHLKLYTQKDFLYGDNSDIVATDSQKNTVYVLAKKYGIENPEKFALILAKHFLSKYAHVSEAHIHVEEYPWQRIQTDVTSNGSTSKSQPHNHAFVFTPTAQRYCDVVLRRTEPQETIISGIKGLRVLKTTQSSFVNFVKDEYRTLADQSDRIFSTVVDCKWEYSHANNLNFCTIWNSVKNIILENFAGDPKFGIASPSVQNTLYNTQKQILDTFPQVEIIAVTMPNKHYFNFDTKPFQSIVPGENNDVFIPTDKPHGTIYAQLARKDLKSRL